MNRIKYIALGCILALCLVATLGWRYLSPINRSLGNSATATALEANGANCSAGNYPLGVDASGAAESCTSVSGGVPTNGIIFTTDATCPTGFIEYTAARGFYLVGVPSIGTNAGTVGSAMTNLQDLTHAHTGPSHTHTYTDVPNHVHSVDPPDTAAGITDPGHTHPQTLKSSGTSGAGNGAVRSGENYDFTALETLSKTTGLTASVNIAAFNSDNPTGGVATGTTATGGTGSTGTASTSSIAPYIQLRLCQKS